MATDDVIVLTIAIVIPTLMLMAQVAHITICYNGNFRAWWNDDDCVTCEKRRSNHE